jgi:hypothetical protein
LARYALEQRIMELESGRLEHHVRVEDHAALADERDSLARRLREADDETSRLHKLLDAERQQASATLMLSAVILVACMVLYSYASDWACFNVTPCVA